MAESSIEWTDKVWNPVRGCVKVSAGCKNCYAETFAERWRGVPGHAYEQGFDLRLVPEKVKEPLKWGKSSRVFVNSMSDLFQDGIPDEFIDEVFATMARAYWHTFQILTKRPERMRSYFADGHRAYHGVKGALARDHRHYEFRGFPLKNVWLGVSVEDQAAADARIPLLLQTPAAVRWISAEPLLGPLNLDGDGLNDLHALGCGFEGVHSCDVLRLDWVVVGGESGHGARRFNLDWARNVIGQCRAANVPIFVKQLGANAWHGIDDETLARYVTVVKKGGDPREWPEDLRVREFPRG